MNTMMEMMRAMPESMTMPGMDMAMMTECIEACNACSMAATMCAADSGMGMEKCSVMCTTMADMAMTMMRMMMRPVGYDMTMPSRHALGAAAATISWPAMIS